MLPVACRILQFLLPFRRVNRHLPVDVNQRGMVLYPVKAKRVMPFIEGCGDGTQQPILENADTANTAFVEIQPVRRDECFCIAMERNFLEECKEDRLELGTIDLFQNPLSAAILER